MKISRFLGHSYTLKGRVTKGDGRGRTIGYPTANVALPPQLLLPAYGVYAVRVELDGAQLDGVANLGLRPTVTTDTVPKLEVHLFDTLQEIYGKTLTVTFVDSVRDERKFASLDALKAQIEQDCNAARTILRRHHA